MRVSIFLSIVSVLLGIATFFIKLDTKPKIISSRIAALVFIILGVAFSYFSFKDMIADMKSEGSANSAFASQSSNHGSNVAIEGDNNITIFNGQMKIHLMMFISDLKRRGQSMNWIRTWNGLIWSAWNQY